MRVALLTARCSAPQAALLLIKQQQRVMAEHAHGVRWGRFTVLLRWQRGAPATNRELAAFCSHYGPVRCSAGHLSVTPMRSTFPRYRSFPVR